MKNFLTDLWLGFGILGMAVGLAAPFIMMFYLLYLVLE